LQLGVGSVDVLVEEVVNEQEKEQKGEPPKGTTQRWKKQELRS